MAKARIDYYIIAKLVTDQFNLIDGNVVNKHLAAESQEGLSGFPLAILDSISFDHTGRSTNRDDPDMASITVTVYVLVDEEQSRNNLLEIYRIASYVCAPLINLHAQDSATGHYVLLQTHTVRFDAIDGENKGIRQATIEIKGTAHRSSGTSISTT